MIEDEAGQADNEAGQQGVADEQQEQDQQLAAGEEQQAAEGEQQQEEKVEPLSSGQQKVFDTAMHGKTQKLREQERENTKLQEENAALQAKIPKSERPAIPDLPDTFAENYTELMATRDKAIQDASAFDQQERTASEKLVEDQKTQQRQAAETMQSAVQGFNDRGSKLGVKPEELAQAGQTMITLGMGLEVQAHIIDQPLGPQLAVYLAKHPIEADALIQMPPMKAAAEISATLLPKVVEFFKNPDLPPDPAENLNGQGNSAGQRGPAGATFE